MTTDPINFIQRVWALQRTDGRAHGFTSQKDWTTGSWRDFPTEHIDDVDMLNNRDIYFCPNLFTEPHRQREYALSSRVLYADLDEVDPAHLPRELRPSLAWETSPGRWQALWIVDRPLTRDRFERLNKRLTYATGADKGGWSVTKVLRVPGTISTKYGTSRAKRFTVHLVSRGKVHTVQDLMASLPKLTPGKSVVDPQGIFGPNGVADLPERSAVFKQWRTRLPRRAVSLLGVRGPLTAADDRSRRLWELYSLLLQAGVPPVEVLVLVRASVWNKYKGQRRELTQLQSEIAKAADKHAVKEDMDRLVGESKRKSRNERNRATNGNSRLAKSARRRVESEPNILPFLTHEEFMAMRFPAPEWLVDGVWVKGAYGVCAGEYKSFKTTVLLNMAMSVASGTPMLENERLAVPEKGLVLYLHEEGRQGGIQDRLHRMAQRKGIGPQVKGNTVIAPVELPMHITSFSGFKLSEEKSQKRLVRYVDRYKPKLIIMEAWYLIASEIDENNASEVAPVLDWLTKVSQEFDDTAIIISHHYNKGDAGGGEGTSKKRAATRMSGSGVFGRWYESALFLERKGAEDEYMASFEAQHREQKGIPRQTIRVDIDTENEDDWEVTFVEDDTARESEIIDMANVPEPKKTVVNKTTGKRAANRKRKESEILKFIEELIQDDGFARVARVKKRVDYPYRVICSIAKENGLDVVKEHWEWTNKDVWVIRDRKDGKE